MKTSIATVSLSGDLGGKLEAIAAAGFDGFELFDNDLTFSLMSPREVRMRADDLGLTVVTLQPMRDFEGMLDARRSAVFDRLERKFDVMDELGTDLMFVCSSVSPHAADGIERSVADFRELGRRAADRGYRVAYEALAWGRHVRDWMQAWEIVRRTDLPNVGLVLDTYHLFARGNPTAPIREVPGEKIFLVQLADAPSLDMEVLRHSRHLRNFPGQGDYPIVDFMVELAATGYDGWISHEIFNDDFRVAPAEQTAVDGYRSMVWLEEQVTKTLRSKPVRPGRLTEGPTWTRADAVSRPVSFRDVAFVEFAVTSEHESSELDTFLRAIGFDLTHQHKSKSVRLYTHGGAAIAVNAEPNSYARSFAERHGAAACAVGLTTDDADAALARAAAYGISGIAGPRRDTEIRMPAIVGVGGALMYFVDARLPHFTETDFDALEGTDIAGPKVHIDHVAQAVAPYELLSVSLFYRAVLGFSLQAPQELADPRGLVTSRTVVSPNGQIRFPLNATLGSGETAPERFRSAQHGSGVQHIALATESIAATRQRLDSSHVLTIPENYYVDLEARFGLDGDTLEFLRAQNILYDRTDDGEFFHLYTREIHGVFFEFVQRNNYGGFGAANAPVRLAAQSRVLAEVLTDNDADPLDRA